MRKLNFLLIFFLVGTLAFPVRCFGLMSSTNYTIFADSVDSGGGLSTGATYSLQDTLGESPIASSTSGSAKPYTILAGYQYMDSYYLSLSLSTSTIDLGTLDVATVASSSLVATVTTDIADGYVLSLNNPGFGRVLLTGVVDGSVTAGQEEFGIAVRGVDALFADDRAELGLNLASSSTAVTASETQVIFKAAINSATVAGDQSRSMTLDVYATI